MSSGIVIDAIDADYSIAPIWADRIIKNISSKVSRVFGESYLPSTLSLSGSRSKRNYILGCGHYGCVYPTQNENMVLKLTSDPTEINLVKFIFANDMTDELEGMVRYYSIMETGYKFRRRDVYALWREEAYFKDLGPATETDMRNNRIMTFKYVAHDVKSMYDKYRKRDGFAQQVELAYDRHVVDEVWVDQPGYARYAYAGLNARKVHVHELMNLRNNLIRTPTYLKYADRTGWLLRLCKEIAEQMSQITDVYLIGTAFLQLMSRGVLLADVHTSNIGQVIRKENYNEPVWVITDPGHSVFLGFDVESYVTS